MNTTSSRSTSTPMTEISSDSSQYSDGSDVDDYETSTTPSTSAVTSFLDKLKAPKTQEKGRYLQIALIIKGRVSNVLVAQAIQSQSPLYRELRSLATRN